MQNYDYIDKVIGKILYEQGEMRANELHREVCDKIEKENRTDLNRGRPLLPIPSRPVFWFHLDLMIEQQKIKRREEKRFNRRGEQTTPYVYYSLTSRGKAEVELEIFEGARSGRQAGKRSLQEEKESKVVENKKIYLSSLILAALGTAHMKYTSKPVVGGAVIPSQNGKGYKTVIFDALPGVGVSDFFVKPRSFGIGGLFAYLEASSRTEILEHLEKLERTYPSIIDCFEYNGEIRYKIKDPIVHEFLAYCVGTLSEVKQRMRLTWKYIRKPKSEEKAWYELLQGKEKARRFFLNAQQKREDLSKKLTSVKNSKIKEIKTYDSVIKQWYEKLGSLYNNMPEEFLPFKKELLEEVVFPSFWQNLYKKSKT